MPIYATTEALAFWKPGHARSLAASRFVTLAASGKDSTWRTQTCDSIRKGAALAAKAGSFNSFATALTGQGASSFFAKLEARLILNAGEGVVENGGICLDRNSGVPYIPGSAIKAAARRFAIHQLGLTGDPMEKAGLLSQICLTFGHGDTEWKPGRKAKKDHPHGGPSHSDFWLAMAPLEDAGAALDCLRDEIWSNVSEEAARSLFSSLNRKPKFPDEPLAPQLPNLAGCISFLPAYPTTEAKIETDVLTPHHKQYYERKKDKAGNLLKPTATDDEDPVPIVFPAVRKGTTYQFTLLPRDENQAPGLLESATLWLSEALEAFGLGAKTNAGYGWFSIDDATTKRAKDQQEIAKLGDGIPDEALLACLHELHGKGLLPPKLNAYSYDQKLWPKDSAISFELSLFEFVKSKAPDLANSKKGKKAMENLAVKLNRPFP